MMGPNAAAWMSFAGAPGGVSGSDAFALMIAASLLAAGAGLLWGWKRTCTVACCRRRRLARAALLALFLTPAYMGPELAPASVCLLAGAVALAQGHPRAALALGGWPLATVAIAALSLFAACEAYARLRGRALAGQAGETDPTET